MEVILIVDIKTIMKLTEQSAGFCSSRLRISLNAFINSLMWNSLR